MNEISVDVTKFVLSLVLQNLQAALPAWHYSIVYLYSLIQVYQQ